MICSLRFALMTLLLCNIAAFASVTVSTPTNGSTIGTSVEFVASASSDAGLPISSMMIYVDNQSDFLVYSNSLNTTLSLSPGAHVAVVKSWDSGGNLYSTTVSFTSSTNSTSPSGSTGVTVVSPTPGATLGSPAHFNASAISTGQYPITSMMIYVDNQAQYTTYASSLDAYLNLSPGSHVAVVKSWDASGAIYSQTVPFTCGTSQSGSSGVTVTSPTPGASLGSPAHFTASAISANQYPITSMMIYVDDQSQYTTYASSLDTYVNLGPGNHTAVVKSWDASGAIYAQTVPFTVGSVDASPASASSVTGASTISDIQQMWGWNSCSDCAGAGQNVPMAQFSMTQNVGSPSLDGNATQFWLGGNTPYANALWWKDLSSGSGASHFTYDLYFYMDNPNAAEALEFDVNLVYNGRYYVFGTQCSPRWSGTWDTWNANDGTWNSTGVGCPTFPAYNWNHVTIELERTWDSQLHWIAITMNGARHPIDRYVASNPTGYNNGVGIDFQMDGDYNQENYSVWLDKVSLSYY